MGNFGELSDKRIKDICRNFCRYSVTEEEAIDKIRKRFAIKLVPVHFSESNSFGQKLFAGMIFGPRGNSISF